jgi:hypothetical protein
VHLYFEAIPGVSSNFLTMAEASKLCPYFPDYLNILVRKGSISVFKLKQYWLVYKDALKNYLNSQNENPATKK